MASCFSSKHLGHVRGTKTANNRTKTTIGKLKRLSHEREQGDHMFDQYQSYSSLGNIITIVNPSSVEIVNCTLEMPRNPGLGTPAVKTPSASAYNKTDISTSHDTPTHLYCSWWSDPVGSSIRCSAEPRSYLSLHDGAFALPRPLLDPHNRGSAATSAIGLEPFGPLSDM